MTLCYFLFFPCYFGSRCNRDNPSNITYRARMVRDKILPRSCAASRVIRQTDVTRGFPSHMKQNLRHVSYDHCHVLYRREKSLGGAENPCSYCVPLPTPPGHFLLNILATSIIALRLEMAFSNGIISGHLFPGAYNASAKFAFVCRNIYTPYLQKVRVPAPCLVLA